MLETSHIRSALCTLQAEQMHKMTSISLKMVEVVILIENSCNFVSCSACNNNYVFSSQLEISHVLKGTTHENQHRNRGPKSAVAAEMRLLSMG